MRREIVYYCEAPDCDTHQHTSSQRQPQGWIITTEDEGAWRPRLRCFCGWDCVLRFASTIDPPIVIT